MSAVRRAASATAIGACIVWALATLLTVGSTYAKVEYSLTAHEARSVARARSANLSRSPSPKRRIIGDGSVKQVRTDLSRFLGRRVTGLESQDRVTVHAKWFERVVTVPVKDRDEWDIVGVVALRAEPWNELPIPAGGIVAAMLMAIALVLRGLRRLEADAHASTYAFMIAPVAALAVTMAALAVLVRARIDGAALEFPILAVRDRFDSLTLPLPNGQVSGLWLALILVLAATLLFIAGWAASASRRPAARRETLTAWAFLAPSALHLLIFTAGPLLFTLYVSLHDWDLLQANRPFVGLGNYAELARDPLFWKALGNTFIYALYVPFSMALALGAALVLDQPLKGMKALRALVFLPTVVSYVAIAVVWQWMFNLDYGLLNYLLRALHLPGVDWLGNPKTALLAVMLVSAWVQLGFQMVIFLAGLQGIPAHLHEAATLDGAGPWLRFRHITLPLLRPVTVYLFVTGIIWSFQVFTLVYVMTEGGPVHATDVLVYRIYQNAWEFRRMGYASAMSWVLFAILLILTLLQWRALNKKVDYAA